MIRIRQLKLSPNHTNIDLKRKILKTLCIHEDELCSYKIVKQSIDARKKEALKYVYTVDATVKNELHILKRAHNKSLTIVNDTPYCFPNAGTLPLIKRPIIIGSGPAGLFCAYMLAKHGYKPIVFERGASVEERQKDIEEFWRSGILNTQSNVQFGEGGAGTFSDGKLNTLVKDSFGRNKTVLEIFVENGAPEDILYINKPHIGTDLLIQIVRNMRQQIIEWGGDFHFHSQFVDFTMNNDTLHSVIILSNNQNEVYESDIMVLAIGHSARDTFSMLYEKKLPLVAKPFAVGVRVEHSQNMIDASQYGGHSPYKLPAASYKMTANLENGRGVYSFCMCPGGFVVNASSENGHLAINGMSYHARDGKNANSAIIVSVTPDDFQSNHPLAGIEFQRKLEKCAYEIGKGNIPVQRFEDFCLDQSSNHFGTIQPQMKGSYKLANVRSIFPKVLAESIETGIKSFDRQIHGFANNDTLLSGVESRTSSPIRILRNESLQIETTGIYPCGEGAGYAGGITSAAMDGIKVAEEIAKKYYFVD